jgi:hydroxyacylglutathione hydrolase
MVNAQESTGTIAIIGGGVSGTLTAYHLAQLETRARIILISQQPAVGLGLAYSTPSLRHLLNVPAGKISALPDQPNHFLHWLRAHHDPSATAETFAPRAIFGRYIQHIFSQAENVETWYGQVTGYRPLPNGARLTLEDGRRLHANLTVLATGNFDPASLPGIAPEAELAGVYCHNAWKASTYTGLAPNAPVTIIGTGLTAIDVLLRLRETGHHGPITAVSRHSVFPHHHAPYRQLPSSAIPLDTPATCVDYLRALRNAIRKGAEWRAAVDSIRATTNRLWLRLSLRERRRFRRHLQRRWDIVRHRMAPAIGQTLKNELDSGTLVVRQGRVSAVALENRHATVTLHTSNGPTTLTAARVINCTGPSLDYRRVHSPLLKKLFAQGIATPGPLGGGLRTSRDGALVDNLNRTSGNLFTLGPSRQGTLIESIAIPEIRDQAAQLAQTLAQALQHQSECDEETEIAS